MKWYTRFRSLKAKIALLAILCIIIIVYTAVIFDFYSNRKRSINVSKKTAYVESELIASSIREELHIVQNLTRDMAYYFSLNNDTSNSGMMSRTEANKLLVSVLKRNPHVAGIKTIWEPNKFDGRDSLYINAKGHDHTGRFIPYWTMDSLSNPLLTPCTDYSGSMINDYYLFSKRLLSEIVSEPYQYEIEGKQTTVITIVSPVIRNGKFSGIVGIDISVDYIEQIIKKSDLYKENSQVELISSKGIITVHSHISDAIGKHIKDYSETWQQDIKTIRSKKSSIITKSKGKLEIQVPILLGEGRNVWACKVLYNAVGMRKSIENQVKTTAFISIVLILLAILIVIKVVQKILKPVDSVIRIAEKVAKGDLLQDVNIEVTTLEISKISNALTSIIANFRDTANFAQKIGSGNFTSSYKPLSEKDILGNSLIEMADRLSKASKEQAERKKLDEQQNWKNVGLTKINDILRENSENLIELSYLVISNLVQYINATMGGIYLIDDENHKEKYLELQASYAYNRRKYIDKKVGLKEGLVGTCALEKETVYITEIPQDYIKVASGLGRTTPSCLLIVPLKTEGIVMGVIEIASMDVFEEYKIEFIEYVAGNIAITLSTVRNTQRTSALLEQSRQQAEAMSSQEEEMRQNMEELQATQEESDRRETEMRGILSSLNKSFYVSEFDLNGNYLKINDRLSELLQLSVHTIVGKKVILSGENENDVEFWSELRKGHIKRRISYVANRNIWLSETYSPIFNNYGRPYKILNIAYDITEARKQEKRIQRLLVDTQNKARKLADNETIIKLNIEELVTFQQKAEKKEAEMSSLLNALDQLAIWCELKPDGTFISVNDEFTRATMFLRDELIGKNIEFLIPKEGNETFYEKWQQLSEELAFSKIIKIVNKTNEFAWLYCSFLMYDSVKSGQKQILMVALNISEEFDPVCDKYKKYLEEQDKKDRLF